MAGLLDQYMIAGNDHALKMTTWMAEYFYNRVQNVITKYTIERHWRSLNEETGGMNDVLYRLYTVTVRILCQMYFLTISYLSSFCRIISIPVDVDVANERKRTDVLFGSLNWI